MTWYIFLACMGAISYAEMRLAFTVIKQVDDDGGFLDDLPQLITLSLALIFLVIPFINIIVGTLVIVTVLKEHGNKVEDLPEFKRLINGLKTFWYGKAE